MKRFRKRFCITVAFLALTSVFHLFYRDANENNLSPKDLSKIPSQIGEWKARDIPLKKEIFDILQTPSVLVREYTNVGGEELLLTIVYYRKNRVEFHSPERCAVGRGSYIAHSGKEDVDLNKGIDAITINKFLVKNNASSNINLYYYESGDFITSSYFSLRWHMILNKLKGKTNSGALVKFSATAEKNADETVKMMKQFIVQINPILKEYLI